MKKSYDIVEMMPGKYALRRTEHSGYGNSHDFKEINNMRWWSAEENVINYCLTSNLKKLREDLQFYKSYSSTGKVVADEDEIPESLAEIMKPIPPKARTIYEDIGKGLKNFFKFPAFKVRLKK